MQTDFDLYQPSSMDNMQSLLTDLQQSKCNYRFLAGGTDLMPQLKRNAYQADALISLQKLPELNKIEINETKVSIGALTNLNEIANHPHLKEHLAALSFAASKVASSQIRNRATLAGNLLVDNRCSFYNQSEFNRQANSTCFKAGGDLCHIIPNATRESSPMCKARFVSDTAPVLLLFNAKLNLLGPDGPRKVALREFYGNEGIKPNKLKKSELIVSIEIATEDYTNRVHYEKLRIRNIFDFPSVGIAVKKSDESNGLRLDVSLTGVETYPIFLSFFEKDFANIQDLYDQACLQSKKAASPLAQDFLATGYRRNMIPVLLKKIISELV